MCLSKNIYKNKKREKKESVSENVCHYTSYMLYSTNVGLNASC